MLTVDQVKERVAKIVQIRSDDEAAHSEEDLLHFEVLQAIADGNCEDPAACAREALKTEEIEFSRWCA